MAIAHVLWVQNPKYKEEADSIFLNAECILAGSNTFNKGTGHHVAEIRFSSEEYTATLSF